MTKAYNPVEMEDRINAALLPYVGSLNVGDTRKLIAKTISDTIAEYAAECGVTIAIQDGERLDDTVERWMAGAAADLQ